MTAVGQRDMSVQEVMHQLLSMKLVSSSFQVLSTSLDGSRRVTVQSNLLHTEKSLFDLYAKRDTYECDFLGISNLNFIKFASSFCKGKLGIARRKTDIVVKTHPNYSPNPKGPSYGLFCKYQLLKYKPWLHSFDSTRDDQDNSDVVYIEKWHEFLASSKAKMLVPNCSLQLDSVSQYVQQDADSPDICESDTGERDEWMYLAELNFNTTSNNNHPGLPKEYWQIDRSNYTPQEIGDMPHWINTQKKVFSKKVDSHANMIDLNSLNQAQKMAYDIAEQHVLFGKEQVFMIITGLVGSGKSYLIDAIRFLLKDTCKVCAFSVLRLLMTILHSLLQLPIKGRRNFPLQSSALSKLQKDLNSVKYLIIDEFSVIGQKMFAWINRLRKQATGLILCGNKLPNCLLSLTKFCTTINQRMI